MLSHQNKKKSNNSSDIEKDLITVNNFFAHWIKEISITRYCSNKKHCYSVKNQSFFAKASYERRNHNSKDLTYTGLDATQTAEKKKLHATD